MLTTASTDDDHDLRLLRRRLPARGARARTGGSSRSRPRSTVPPTAATPASRAASRTSSRARRPADAPLDPRGRRLPRATWDEALDRIVAELGRDQGRARPRRDRRPRLLAGDERGVLRDAAPLPRRDRHAQHRQLLARLPLADVVRAAQVARPLGLHAAPSTTSSAPQVLLIIGANPTAGHPVVGARMKQAALRGTKLDHRRSAADRARRLRRAALLGPSGRATRRS